MWVYRSVHSPRTDYAPHMDPDEAVLAAFAALQRRDATSVLTMLDGLKAADRPGLEGRAAAYRSQALQQLGRLDEAERAAATAVPLAKRAGDVKGVEQLRALHAQLVAALAARNAVTQQRDTDAGLTNVSDDVLLVGAGGVAALVRKANALIDAGRPGDARITAERARNAAHACADAREEVLACLSAARAARADEPAAVPDLIRAAHAVADASNDMNLVTAVAHAARAAGVTLVPPRFG